MRYDNWEVGRLFYKYGSPASFALIHGDNTMTTYSIVNRGIVIKKKRFSKNLKPYLYAGGLVNMRDLIDRMFDPDTNIRIEK